MHRKNILCLALCLVLALGLFAGCAEMDRGVAGNRSDSTVSTTRDGRVNGGEAEGSARRDGNDRTDRDGLTDDTAPSAGNPTTGSNAWNGMAGGSGAGTNHGTTGSGTTSGTGNGAANNGSSGTARTGDLGEAVGNAARKAGDAARDAADSAANTVDRITGR